MCRSSHGYAAVCWAAAKSTASRPACGFALHSTSLSRISGFYLVRIIDRRSWWSVDQGYIRNACSLRWTPCCIILLCLSICCRWVASPSGTVSVLRLRRLFEALNVLTHQIRTHRSTATRTSHVTIRNHYRMTMCSGWLIWTLESD
jgi:hypothetical protein